MDDSFSSHMGDRLLSMLIGKNSHRWPDIVYVAFAKGDMNLSLRAPSNLMNECDPRSYRRTELNPKVLVAAKQDNIPIETFYVPIPEELARQSPDYLAILDHNDKVLFCGKIDIDSVDRNIVNINFPVLLE